MMKVLRIALISFVVLLTTPSFAQEMSEAEVLAAMYGAVIGHIDHCNITVSRSLIVRMGEDLAATAVSSADEDRAIVLLRRTSEVSQRKQTMDCETVRWALESIEEDLF